MDLIYHVKLKNLPEEEIQRRVEVKNYELMEIFDILQPKFSEPRVKAAILGCGDYRFIGPYKKLLESLLQKPVELSVLDLQTRDLEPGKADGINIIQHDCTTPLPGGPYNLIYARVLLKFIEPGKQMDFLMHSYDALAGGGMAIHILEQEDYKNLSPREGCYPVPYRDWQSRLQQNHIDFLNLPLIKAAQQKRDTVALVIRKT